MEPTWINCGDCVFFRSDGVNGGRGACFRHPPAAQLTGGKDMAGQQRLGTIGYRPPVSEEEGCGDGAQAPPRLAS